MTTKQITKVTTQVSLRSIMSEVNGASFISINTSTQPTIRKTLDTDDGRVSNPHFGRVTKHTTASVMVFQNKNSSGYNNMVERRLVKEGKDPESFVLGPRKWGERMTNLPIVTHKGKMYLEVIFLNNTNTQYLLDGNPVDKSDILGLSIKKEGDQGGLNNKVIIRTFNVDNITSIRINSKEYTNIIG